MVSSRSIAAFIGLLALASAAPACLPGSNCFVAPSGATWFSAPTAWSLQSFPTFPATARVSAVAVLSQEARGAAEVLDLGPDGMLDLGVDGIVDLGPTFCRDGEWQVTPLTQDANRVCKVFTVCAAGELETQSPSAMRDRLCRPCRAGHFCP